jgi:hypothetical protein
VILIFDMPYKLIITLSTYLLLHGIKVEYLLQWEIEEYNDILEFSNLDRYHQNIVKLKNGSSFASELWCKMFGRLE